jgi:hypothetical protein
MKTQTFARELWSSLLPRLVCLTSNRGFDVWLLHQVHRPNKALASSSSNKRVLRLLTLLRRSLASDGDGARHRGRKSRC